MTVQSSALVLRKVEIRLAVLLQTKSVDFACDGQDG